MWIAEGDKPEPSQLNQTFYPNVFEPESRIPANTFDLSPLTYFIGGARKTPNQITL
jgi:hypothetical protein